MDIKMDLTDMKTLLEVYEEYRNAARMNKDGFGYLYWSSRCTEVLSIMENMKDDQKEI